ncbi:LRR 8 domain containing protein [Asbolus verrucosus]|uniref:LRR 8 domain containing protein n=1 Tax=Asbolus verrucosus TaxID=1661398 RepID=A0A482WDB4_ASBVE|nr:LRR 8 domain containing protein [Asbolus verrucosus]
MKLILLSATVLHLALGASIVDVTCPDSCTCQGKDEHLEASCISYEFIKKLIPKQVSTIVRLNINNASLVNIDSKLKYLKNLNSLNLSNNNIASLPSQFPYLPKLRNLDLSNNVLRNIVFTQLPKNLEVIDLSNNSIGNFPKEWTSLRQLKTLYLHDNPIDCECNNLMIYEQLLQGGIDISENLTCYYPKEFHGRLLNSINCSLIKENLLNSMLGDEAGSGLEDFESHDEINSPLSDDQDQLMIAERITENPEDDLNDEGSGDEGSGDFISILPTAVPKACHFNCSTPQPIGLNDEKNASSPPDIQEQVGIIFSDVLQPIQIDETTTTPTPQTKEEESTILKETDKNKLESSSTNHTAKEEVESFPTNHTVVGELERTISEGSSSQSVYIIVGLLIAFVAFLVIYFVNKRRNRNKRTQRKRNKSNENGFGEEMKPLGKSTETTKPVENINSKTPNAEATPLLNGQNGKISDDNVKPQPTEENNKDLEDVEIRKDKQEILTPQPERVTIKAGELPDSVPKTPLFVHRQLNSDGEIVTTAVNSN